MADRQTAYELPSPLRRFAARFPGFTERYLALDPRSLGLGRIYLGILLLLDLLRRVPDLNVWYTNEGLLPNHTLLWRPGARFQFSFLFGASWSGEVAVLFALCAVVFICFTIGYRTRLFQALSLACVVSLHDRVIFLENGGDVVLNILLAWTLFLPLGARFSIDALRASLRGRPDRTLEDLADRGTFPREIRPVVSLACLAVILQVSVIYYFNVIHKSGENWRDGSAVHYALYQNRLVTWLGWKLRPFITIGWSRVLSYTALAIEAAGPILVLNPFHWRATRRLAAILMPGLHVGFALLLNLGLFSFNMMAFFVLLLPDRAWDDLARLARPTQLVRRIVYVDAADGLCFQIARVLARLDARGCLRLARWSPELGAALVVEDPDTNERRTDRAALVSIASLLPFGWPLALALRMPLVGHALMALYRFVANRRARLSTAFGCPAADTLDPVASAVPPPPTPFRAGLARGGQWAREVAVVLMLVALGSQVLMENRAIPAKLKLGQADWMRLIVEYPRLFQGWSMFAPNAPTDDRYIVVDAVTVDGRHIDPLNERGSRVAPVPTDVIPEFLDQDEYFCDYMQRISGQGAYHPALSEWIQAHHRRTGRPKDQIVSFDVFSLSQQSPPPGSNTPTDVKKELLFSWPSKH